jgi:hypothetical protein
MNDIIELELNLSVEKFNFIKNMKNFDRNNNEKFVDIIKFLENKAYSEEESHEIENKIEELEKSIKNLESSCDILEKEGILQNCNICKKKFINFD